MEKENVMMVCPTCGKTYDSSWEMCLKCNVPLETKKITSETQELTKEDKIMEKKRSKGVTFFGFYCIINGLAFFVLPIMNHAYLDLIIEGPIGLVIVLIGIGILKLVNWVRIVAIILSIITSVVSLITTVIGAFQNPIVAIITLIPVVISLSIIYFLTRPKVKEQFR